MTTATYSASCWAQVCTYMSGLNMLTVILAGICTTESHKHSEAIRVVSPQPIPVDEDGSMAYLAEVVWPDKDVLVCLANSIIYSRVSIEQTACCSNYINRLDLIELREWACSEAQALF